MQRGGAEFDCEGCGMHVVAFGIDKPLPHQFCSTCAWLCEHVPNPGEMWQIYTRLRDGGDE